MFRKIISTLLICTLCVAITSIIIPRTVDTLANLPSTEIVTPGEENLNPDSAHNRLNKGNALGKRMLIWSAAIKEIQQVNVIELIFGQGASFSSDLYDDFTKPGVKDIQSSYGYSETRPAEKNWMNPHNLFLQDMLDGGLLLLLAQLFIIFVAIRYTLCIIRSNLINGIALALMYGILLVTLLLSSARGMLSNKFFWLIMMLQILEYYNQKYIQITTTSSTKRLKGI